MAAEFKMVPAQVLSGANVILVEQGFLGRVKKVELPNIEFITYENKSTLIQYEQVTSVLKAMTLKLTLNEVNKVYFDSLLTHIKTDKGIVIKQNLEVDGVNKPVEITVGGRFKIVTMPGFEETGKEIEVQLEVAVNAFKYKLEGKDLLNIDVNTLTYLVGEKQVDIYKDLKANLK